MRAKDSSCLLANIEPLKRLLTREQGKPHAEAEAEIAGAGYWLKGAASLDLPVETIEDSADRRIETRRIPHRTKANLSVAQS